jgi:hypothetical protein
MNYCDLLKENNVNSQKLKYFLDNSADFNIELCRLIEAYHDNYRKLQPFILDGTDKNDVRFLTTTALRLIYSKIEKEYRPLDFDNLKLISKDFKYVQVLTQGGFANRLRALASFNVISKIYGLQRVALLWLPDEGCPCDFEEIFNIEKSFNSISSQDVSRYLLIEPSCMIISSIDSAGVFFSKYVYQTGMGWDEFFIMYKAELNLILKLLNKKILTKIEVILGSVTPSTIGVHIRGTDFYDHYKIHYPSKRLATVEDFLLKLKNEYPDFKSVYLATDDPSNIYNFVRSFDGLVLYNNPELTLGRKRLTTVMDGVIDLILLSRCHLIIATDGSSFSQTASDLGSIPRVCL